MTGITLQSRLSSPVLVSMKLCACTSWRSSRGRLRHLRLPSLQPALTTFDDAGERHDVAHALDVRHVPGEAVDRRR